MKLFKIYRISIYAAVVLFILQFGSPTLAVPIQDQGQIFGTGGEVSITTDILSQSITTGIAGQLTGIQIQYNGDDVSPAPLLEFSIVEGGNPPVGNVLFTVQLDLGDVNFDDLITWDLTGANLFFDVGAQFTFAFSSADDSGFDIAGNDPPGYDDGELFRNGIALPDDEINDIAFITFVDPDAVFPVPEPTVLPPLLIGLLSLGFATYRKRRSQRSHESEILS